MVPRAAKVIKKHETRRSLQPQRCEIGHRHHAASPKLLKPSKHSRDSSRTTTVASYGHVYNPPRIIPKFLQHDEDQLTGHGPNIGCCVILDRPENLQS